jgi:mRNA interferase MazF
VVQNDVGNRLSPVTIVVPITSRPRREFPFLVRIPDDALPRRSTADCAHIQTVDKRRITGEPVATLDQETMSRVDAALRISLALD